MWGGVARGFGLARLAGWRFAAAALPRGWRFCGELGRQINGLGVFELWLGGAFLFGARIFEAGAVVPLSGLRRVALPTGEEES